MAGAPATDSAAAATGAAAVPLLLPLDDAVAGGGCWEDAAISLGLVGVQLASAAYMVVLTPVLALGGPALPHRLRKPVHRDPHRPLRRQAREV